jgi:hypothetical protein
MHAEPKQNANLSSPHKLIKTKIKIINAKSTIAEQAVPPRKV